ncbi:hypothetical protein L484_015935 [Morus notabilis]|uniref:Uncharacterized protein n=1 Tax=Morus notabilis TaxID=981085 RepID=W9QYN8_9ROSA|nr:hypothetical protein L484_015935 [Morus notabilis]
MLENYSRKLFAIRPLGALATSERLLQKSSRYFLSAFPLFLHNVEEVEMKTGIRLPTASISSLRLPIVLLCYKFVDISEVLRKAAEAFAETCFFFLEDKVTLEESSLAFFPSRS